jgi:coenzyme PQQ precursor peptide PqqA
MKIMSVDCGFSRTPGRTGRSTMRSDSTNSVKRQSATRIAALDNRRQPVIKEFAMAWTKPEFTDLRFGFEVTMYICNR